MSVCIFCGIKFDHLIDNYCEDCFNMLFTCTQCGEIVDELDDGGICFDCRRENGIAEREGYDDARDQLALLLSVT